MLCMTGKIPVAAPGKKIFVSVYAATKSAVETLTNIFAKELRGRNISVNTVTRERQVRLDLRAGQEFQFLRRVGKVEPGDG